MIPNSLKLGACIPVGFQQEINYFTRLRIAAKDNFLQTLPCSTIVQRAAFQDQREKYVFSVLTMNTTKKNCAGNSGLTVYSFYASTDVHWWQNY